MIFPAHSGLRYRPSLGAYVFSLQGVLVPPQSSAIRSEGAHRHRAKHDADLPTVSQVTRANLNGLYYCLVLDLDLDLAIIEALTVEMGIALVEQGIAVRADLTEAERLATDAQPLRVERLAAAAGMSPPSLHQHFRAVTSLSPLQFQKQLRLIEARRMMLSEGSSASIAAYAVGYESVPQFTR